MSTDAAKTALLDALLSLQTRAEADAFLSDLCTPAELRAFGERWQVARLLDGGDKTYREIAVEASASPTTVVRVARSLDGSRAQNPGRQRVPRHRADPRGGPCGRLPVSRTADLAARGTHHLRPTDLSGGGL